MKPQRRLKEKKVMQDRGTAIGTARRWLRRSGQQAYPPGRRQAREVVRAVWAVGRQVTPAELALLGRSTGR